jgi:hypothetical protein
VFHGHLDYLGSGGWAIDFSAQDGGSSTRVDTVVSIDGPEVVFGNREVWSNTLDPVVAVRARPGGVFNLVRGPPSDSGYELWTIDKDGNEGRVGRYEGVPHPIGVALTVDDELFVAGSDTEGEAIWRCRADGECSIVSRIPNVQALITGAIAEDPEPAPYNPPPALEQTLEEGLMVASDGLVTDPNVLHPFERRDVHIAGHIVHPGHDNHGLPAVALYGTPWKYVLGFPEVPLALRVGKFTLGNSGQTDDDDRASRELCYQDSIGFWRMGLDYIGPLPVDDAHYYPASPRDNDLIIPTAECPNARFSSSCRLACSRYDYFDDVAWLDVGSPPAPDFAGEPAVVTMVDEIGQPVTSYTGQIMDGPVVAAVSDDVDYGEALPDGFRLVVRVQDPVTFELTNVWQLWMFNEDVHEIVGTYQVPEEYMDLPLVRPDVGAVSFKDRFYLAFKDETPEDDPERKGDYLLRIDLAGNVQVSRTGKLAVDFLFSGQ